MKRLIFSLLCAVILISCAAEQKRKAHEGLTIPANTTQAGISLRIAEYLKTEGYSIKAINTETGFIETRPLRSTYEPVIRKIAVLESQFISAAEMSLLGPLMCTTVVKVAVPKPGNLLVHASVFKDNDELDVLRSAKLSDYYAREIARILK
jgi:hypothetical protein